MTKVSRRVTTDVVAVRRAVRPIAALRRSSARAPDRKTGALSAGRRRSERCNSGNEKRGDTRKAELLNETASRDAIE
jgi:hypothetical protein